MKNLIKTITAGVPMLLLLTAAVVTAGCATPEQPPQPMAVEIEPEPAPETPVPVYMNSRYRELMLNSMYEISQPRGLRFTARVFPPRRALDEAPAEPGLLVYVHGEDIRIDELQELVGLPRSELNELLQRRVGSFGLAHIGETPFVVVFGGNIDAALMAVESNQELQELVLETLGQHFYQRE
ncbi:hypothetical protein [Spirochaeta africana]|uniref:Preprotein translocase subunit SecD n=1 Tax=Spirochaeta africana (strain ATCC 700263 / DSM 8902 / Z-7692) TaxID=889378 RepID=H9UJV3_SPIAZ|nr:hypothetical protein [Spirochaeta africana]AFG37796.1 hypothetical protein Spiaf_1739 [Spirochaeta africana DSM 8902]